METSSTDYGESKNGHFMDKLRQWVFGADPISAEAKEMLERDYENGYLIVDALAKAKNKEKIHIELNDGENADLNVA